LFSQEIAPFAVKFDPGPQCVAPGVSSRQTSGGKLGTGGLTRGGDLFPCGFARFPGAFSGFERMLAGHGAHLPAPIGIIRHVGKRCARGNNAEDQYTDSSLHPASFLVMTDESSFCSEKI
jgi:hypothetical protein